MNRGKLWQSWFDPDGLIMALLKTAVIPMEKNGLGVACAGGSAGLDLVAMKAEECSDIWPL
jgi:hypothetical protein